MVRILPVRRMFRLCRLHQCTLLMGALLVALVVTNIRISKVMDASGGNVKSMTWASHDQTTRHQDVRQGPHDPTIEAIQQRVRHVQNRCRGMQGHQGVLRRVYVSEGTKLAYCPVAKIGTTFWKRVFLFLNNDTGLYHVPSPFQIPRSFVHYGNTTNTKVLKRGHMSGAILNKYTRIMFSRNPYARLWSAYLDKLYLPDFWKKHSGKIIKTRTNITEEASKCHNDVSFREFLEYVVSGSKIRKNEHWQPIKYRCDPCQFRPNIIGKMETFSDDARYTLEGNGRGWMLKSFDYDAYVREELTTLIDYNFDVRLGTFLYTCINKTELIRRLWTVFQWNGFLSNNTDATSVVKKLTKMPNINRTVFRKFVLDTYFSASKMERKKWKNQRQEALIAAYKCIPISLLKSVMELFKDDFEDFGYSNIPPGFEYVAQQ
ncbi:carbohydrate sulfotransferase 11-like [Haliotis rufescens]|uniref:carbohydrate sulfotransferase 11-like n=1 Tax=Haliotis rufescens TaxID=6454 RepID=UPI00201F81C2|nr:carbohydrate sulfotransferase 11-like [Haliotis rufescens]